MRTVGLSTIGGATPTAHDETGRRISSAPCSGGSSFGALDRTFALLEAVAGESSPQSLSSLSRRICAPKTSVHRLLGVLVRNDLLERRDEGYAVGSATRRLSHLVLDRVPPGVVEVLRPFAGDLFERTGDCVVIGVPDGGSVEIVHTIRSHRHSFLPVVEDRVPMGRSAIGKLWLAGQPDAALLPWLALEHADPQRALTELRRVRQTGVATVGGNGGQGVVEIAMSVGDGDGMVAGIARRYASGRRPALAAAIAHRQVTLAASAAVRQVEAPRAVPAPRSPLPTGAQASGVRR